METRLTVDILAQPDDNTCGATCLHSVYRYYGDEMPLEQVIAEVSHLEEGGTLDVLLACHALRRGYQAKIFTYNLNIFDPTWFAPGADEGLDIRERMREQMAFRPDHKLAIATEARYIAMIGSKRKVLNVIRELEKLGIARAAFERIHAPMGLDIGAISPEEIAISVAAEMIAIRRNPASDWRALSLSVSKPCCSLI